MSVLDYVHDYGYNKDMNFEWDENKREANIAKHGLDLMTGVACSTGDLSTATHPLAAKKTVM